MNFLIYKKDNYHFEDLIEIARGLINNFGPILGLMMFVSKYKIVFSEDGIPIKDFIKILGLPKEYESILKNIILIFRDFNYRINSHSNLDDLRNTIIEKCSQEYSIDDLVKILLNYIKTYKNVLGILKFVLDYGIVFSEHGFSIDELIRLAGLTAKEAQILRAAIQWNTKMHDDIKKSTTIEEVHDLFPISRPVIKKLAHPLNIDELAKILRDFYYNSDNKKVGMFYFIFVYGLSYEQYKDIVEDLLMKAGLTLNYKPEILTIMRVYDLVKKDVEYMPSLESIREYFNL